MFSEKSASAYLRHIYHAWDSCSCNWDSSKRKHFEMVKKRAASHSGSWYSSSSKILNKQILSWINKSFQNGSSQLTKILIAPHAGYTYSGPTAGHAYSSLSYNDSEEIKDQGKIVFLLGPSHHVSFSMQAALSICDVYETPVGPIKVDRVLCDTLYNSGLFNWMDQGIDENEHSLEMHLPFLRHVFSKGFVSENVNDCSCKLVPILIGNPSLEQEAAIAKVLIPYFLDPNCIFRFLSLGNISGNF